MAVIDAPIRSLLPRISFDRATVTAVAIIVCGTLLLRIPSLFEPPWHTDEGIFAAVAQRVLHGGELYTDAWESKPPLFLFLYAAIFKLFGVGVFQLHLAATTFAIGAELTLYAIARRLMSRRQALIAALFCALLLGVPFWEGNLALTEIFAVFPGALAVLCVLRWTDAGSTGRGQSWLFAAGVLLGITFLIRQTAIAPGIAAGLWLLVSGRPWLRPGLLMSAGMVVVVAPVVGLFALLGSFHWLWDANVGFFFQYVPSGEQLPFRYRAIVIAPVVLALACLIWYQRRGESPRWGLPALWLSITLAAALLTGRPYSHYMLQVFPPLGLLVALIAPHVRLSWRPNRAQAPALAFVSALALLWVVVVMPEFHGNPFAVHYTRGPAYYTNFFAYATGQRDRDDYNNYFDRRVNLTRKLDERLEALGAEGKSVYVWGEYPWVYPLADVTPATRYTTSFYVLLIPYLDTSLARTLAREDPQFIVTMADARTELSSSSVVVGRRYAIASLGLQHLLERRYELVTTIDKAQIYRRVPERIVPVEQTARSEDPLPGILERP